MKTSVVRLRLYGLLACIGAPAIYLETLRHAKNGPEDLTSALLYGLFSLGWCCGLLGLKHLRATGDGKLGRGLLTVAVLTAGLSVGQTFMDLLHVPKEWPLYRITDLAWPVTMLLTFVISVSTCFARTLPVWGRLVLLYCGLSLPATILLGALNVQLPFDTFGPHTASGWALWGLLLLVLAGRETRNNPSLAFVSSTGGGPTLT